MSDRRLYIVDDDDDVRSSLQSLASIRAGIEVKCFISGDSFLGAVDELEPGCILLDLHMPGLSGLDVLAKIEPPRYLFSPIILTGQGDVGPAVQAMKLGAIDFLEKPCDPQTLLHAIDLGFEWLEHRRMQTARENDAKTRLALLSPRELDVVRGLINGMSNKLIAHDLDISPRTVEIYRAKAMEKLEVRSLSEALRLAFAAGMLSE